MKMAILGGPRLQAEMVVYLTGARFQSYPVTPTADDLTPLLPKVMIERRQEPPPRNRKERRALQSRSAR